MDYLINGCIKLNTIKNRLAECAFNYSYKSVFYENYWRYARSRSWFIAFGVLTPGFIRNKSEGRK